MAEYLPVAIPGRAITLKASVAVTGGQIVEVTGSGTVGPAAAASLKVVGTAGFDAAANDNVLIWTPGIIQHATAAGAITAGDQVQTGAAGTIASGTTAPIGVALTTAASGADVRYLERK